MKFEDLMKLPEFNKYTAPPEDGDYDQYMKSFMEEVFNYLTVRIGNSQTNGPMDISDGISFGDILLKEQK